MTLWTPSTEDILNLTGGVRRRVDRFRFELCDRDWRPIGDLHPSRLEVPTIRNDTSSNTSRRLSNFRITPDEADDVNTLTDRLRVYMQLQNGVEFRLGSFLWGDENRPERSWGAEQHSELVDPTYILDQECTRALSWSRGASIGLVLFYVAFAAGFELADIAVMGDEASDSTSEPLAWEPGTHWLQILTDIGNLVGFAAPWFDRDGRLHFDQPPDPTIDHPTVDPYEAGGRIIADSILHSSDILAAPNDFAVYDSGTDRLRSGRFQLPANAPHSFNERGFRIGATESVQGLNSQAQANKAAKNLPRTRGEAFEWITFQSTLDPRHDTWDVVDVLGQRWLEMLWSMELRSGGRMEHVMRRTTYEL